MASCSSPSGRSVRVGGRDEDVDLVAEHQPHAPVGGAERTGADPHHLARRAQRVEVSGLVVGHPSGEHVGLEDRGGDRRALQHPERLDQRVEAAAGQAHALPLGQEAGQRRRVDRLDLAPEGRQRAAPELAQHVVVAPLALDAVGAELASHDPTLGLQPFQRPEDPSAVGAEAGRRPRRVRNGPWVRA